MTPRRAGFYLLLGVSLLPWVGPPLALALGAAFALALGNPLGKRTGRIGKVMLQLAVVGLGFGLDVREVLRVGAHAIPTTLVGIAATIGAGALLARLLRAEATTAFLVTTGTAICGGSAIAAMAPTVRADERQTAVALATVFALNSAGLVLFPPLGQWLGLDQGAFGVWAALAIHDTSSVVGATQAFGEQAQAVGTTVKLARALWILPLVTAAGWFVRARGKASFPLFLLGFLAAATLRALLPGLEPAWEALEGVARRILVATLFLVGAGLTRGVLQRIGARPLAHGVILWALVSVATLGALRAGWLAAPAPAPAATLEAGPAR